ncbi:Plant L-ascorbate oxidase [Striga hermonthica]|uniref:L-ascorbate oxidase n=1 Tax=Striga hermonthica TaxID=68872 RepID=A0A9N7MB49_STRHE|nr:Plant L-ascorbate oxidase [Striga hermonthica]
MGSLTDDPRLLLRFLIVSCFIFVAMMVVECKDFSWTVEYIEGNPDGVEGIVMAINGQFPGPEIRVRAGETVRVNLTNGLSTETEGVVIHWHGIRQLGTPWADGAASISQCPIMPGESFVYEFLADKPGTYFYHGHYGMQRTAGLYGMLVVDVAQGEEEKIKYDGEFNMLLSDWWHDTVQTQAVHLDSKPMKWINEPQSLLINGRGQYNCSLAAKYETNTTACTLRGSESYAPYIFKVDPNKTYRFRIASATSLASLNLAFGNHMVEVVEADGNYVQPFNTSNIYIYPGETYSILLRTNQDPTQNYWIRVAVVARDPKTHPALTFLQYSPNSASVLPSSAPPPAPLWNDFPAAKNFSKQILARDDTTHPPPPATSKPRTLVLLNTQNLIDGRTKWALNNISLVLPTTPYLAAIKNNIPDAFDRRTLPDWPEYIGGYDITKPPENTAATTGDMVYTFGTNETVDVILQNANVLAPVGKSEAHPWHLHGHDFWVLGYGEGKFTEDDRKGFNVKNPPARFTTVVYPFGWTAVRFVADNPGVWPFHCHIEPHMYMGMGVVFAEGVDKIGTLPPNGFTCGKMGRTINGKS